MRTSLGRPAPRDMQRKTEPRAVYVEYRAREGALRIELTNRAAVTLPVSLIASLRGAASADEGQNVRRVYTGELGEIFNPVV